MSEATIYVLPVRPIAAAYAECHWDAGCTYCGAPGGEYCRRDDGTIRRIPCARRMIPTSPADVEGRSLRPVRDFTEPLHCGEA